jgi:hypothetical protein
MGFDRRPPLDPGRSRHVPEFTDDEVGEVLAALRANAPELVAVLERQAREPGSVVSADYDEMYDRMLTYLFERGYVHTHIEMAVLFRAVVERVGLIKSQG